MAKIVSALLMCNTCVLLRSVCFSKHCPLVCCYVLCCCVVCCVCDVLLFVCVFVVDDVVVCLSVACFLCLVVCMLLLL